jgi:hypothetical protein
MKIIAHRGNIDGPDPKNENNPLYIDLAIKHGFDVEVDIWVVDNEILLGHDSPQYAVNRAYIADIGPVGWFHCKNIGALKYFKDSFSSLNYFWHQEDDFTLTSHKYIWTYPGKEITSDSVVVMPERVGKTIPDGVIPYGVCTDFCNKLLENIN